MSHKFTSICILIAILFGFSGFSQQGRSQDRSKGLSLTTLIVPGNMDQFAVSPDGSVVAAAKLQTQRTQIIDVETREVVKELETPKPMDLMFRGDQLFVLQGDGTIGVFETKGWEQVNELQHGLDSARSFSAPKEVSFIIVVGMKLNQWQAGVVTVEDDRYQPINIAPRVRVHSVMVSEDGKMAVFNYDDSTSDQTYHKVEDLLKDGLPKPPGYLFAADLKGKTRLIPNRSLVTTGFSLRPAGHFRMGLEGTWGDRLNFGRPSKPRPAVFADESGTWGCRLSRDTFSFHTLDTAFERLWETPVFFTPPSDRREQVMQVNLLRTFPMGQIGFPLHGPHCIIRGSEAHIFAPRPRGGLLHGKMNMPKLEMPTGQIKSGGFHILPTPTAINHMEFEENGSRVFLAMEASNQILVFDQGAKTFGKPFNVPSPGLLLQRGNFLMSIDRQNAKMYVFDSITGKSKGSISIPPNVHSASAARGSFFKGEILLSSKISNKLGFSEIVHHRLLLSNRKYHDIKGYKDSGRYLISADGKFVLEQVDSGGVKAYDISRIRTNFKLQENRFFPHDEVGPLYQVQPGISWFGGNRLFHGAPPRPIKIGEPQMVIPDTSRPLFYRVQGAELQAVTLTDDLKQIKTFQIDSPLPCMPGGSKNKDTFSPAWIAHEPHSASFARMVGKEFHAMAHDHRSGRIYYGFWEGVNVPKPRATAPVSRREDNAVDPTSKVLRWEMKGIVQRFRPRTAGEGTLLQDGNTIHWIDPTGRKIERSKEFETTFTDFFETPRHLVAAHSRQVDIFDRQTLKKVRSIPFPHPVQDLAGIPLTEIGYATLKWPRPLDEDYHPDNPYKPLLKFDTGSDRVIPLKDWFADHVEVSPNGSFIAISVAILLAEYFGGNLATGHAFAEKIEPEILMTGRIKPDGTLIPIGIQTEPGADYKSMAFTSDSRAITWVGLTPAIDKEVDAFKGIPMYDVLEPERPIRLFPIKSAFSTIFHPTHGMCAFGTYKTFNISHVKKAYPVDDSIWKNDSLFKNISKIKDLTFSSDGGRLLFAVHSRIGNPAVLSGPLDGKVMEASVDPFEPWVPPSVAEILAGPQDFGQDKLTQPSPLSMNQLRASVKKHEGERNAVEIARIFKPSVVKISSEGSAGTGFFISDSGHILTCQHVLKSGEAPTIQYIDKNGKTREAIGYVLSANAEKDLALISIKPSAPVIPVKFELSDHVDTGDSVTTIGNPGLGSTTLQHTMTQGIVSSNNRKISGSKFIQTTAPVNPGSSGSPLFNQKGNVIGLVVQKANLERIGFAVPSREILVYLKALAN